MSEYYEMYMRCFPEYPTTPEIFQTQLRPGLAHIVERREDGKLVGCALVHSGSIPMLCVDSAHRGRGLGSAILEECEAYLKERGAEKIVLGCGPHYLLQGVPEGPAVQFFQRRGYAAGWTSINMSLDLAGYEPGKLSIRPAPEGLSFRFAEKSDLPALLKSVEAAESGWVDIFARCGDPILIAELDGTIVGFEILAGGHFTVPGESVGSIGCVGVVPDRRERGIGLAMVAEGVKWLKGHKCTLIELRYTWLDWWYGRLGFRTVSRQWMGEREL